MTYMTLNVRLAPHDVTGEQLAAPSAPLTLFRDLDDYARSWGPYALREWATRRGRTVHSVDNCWVRVPVTPGDVRDFVSTVTGMAPDVPEPDGIYVIEAEEF